MSYEEFQIELCQKIDAGEQIDKYLLFELIYENQVQEYTGDFRRWHVNMTTIVEVNGRYFSINWDKALTEMGCNENVCQPVEVVPVTRIIEVTVYEPIEKKKGV